MPKSPIPSDPAIENVSLTSLIGVGSIITPGIIALAAIPVARNAHHVRFRENAFPGRWPSARLCDDLGGAWKYRSAARDRACLSKERMEKLLSHPSRTRYPGDFSRRFMSSIAPAHFSLSLSQPLSAPRHGEHLRRTVSFSSANSHVSHRTRELERHGSRLSI